VRILGGGVRLVLLFIIAAPLRAQAPAGQGDSLALPVRIAGPQPIPAALLPTDAGTARSPRHDSLSCPDCDPPIRFWAAAGELMLIQAIPFSINHFVRGYEWADVSPKTWKNNLSYPWQWDDNQFLNNQFSHPYQGNLYFNAARTNGYNFWQSAAWPFVGSAMWEVFFEAWAPAPNDFINTSVGGVILGETFNRISNLILDNTATGGERALREVGAALVNPVGGLNRLIRGEVGRVSANPPSWRPSFLLGVLDLGYRRTTQSLGSGFIEEGTNQWNATLSMAYGNPYRDLSGPPFSYFALRADLAGPGNTGLVNQFSARGNLAAWPLGNGRHNQFALSLEYDYFNNPAFVYGGQSAQFGLVTLIGRPGATWWGQTSVLVNGVILGATQSDEYRSVEGRDYDYGPGLGGFASARILYKNLLQGTAAYTGLWIHTLDGSESAHYQDALMLEARYWASRTMGVGLSYTGYNRTSVYRDLPDVQQHASFVRLFLSRAMPRLPQ